MPMACVGNASCSWQHAERCVLSPQRLPRAQRRAAERRAAKASRLTCSAALQFDTKVFQPEKVDLAGTTEYLYRGGRDQFQKLGKVSCKSSYLHVCRPGPLQPVRNQRQAVTAHLSHSPIKPQALPGPTLSMLICASRLLFTQHSRELHQT